MVKRICLYILCSVLFVVASAQEAVVITLFNASFEGVPRHSEPPNGWTDCGFPGESPVDVHPTSQFNVLRPAYTGRTYLGMVTRDNDTWESVQQRLSSPILANQCYTFSIYLCRSDTYTSATRAKPDNLSSFIEPVKLRVWGGSGYCEKKELLGETIPVKNTEWQRYEMKFEPSRSHNYIILEAFYKTPILFPYNGNLLLDEASEIVPVPCKEEVVQQNNRNKDSVQQNIRKPHEITASVVKKVEATSKQEPPKTLGLNRNNLKKGTILTIDNLYFEADSTRIPPACYPILDELYQFMEDNKDIVIEIGGHTNSIPKEEYCNKLSLERAKSVAEYLMQKGIPGKRLFYKGYGKTRPIADDSTPQGKRKNQRVEIKVLYINPQ